MRMNPNSYIKKQLRLVAFFLAVIFSWDTVVWSQPGIMFSPSREFKPLPSLIDLNLPEGIGSIQEKFHPKNLKVQDQPFVIHIQDAHAHPEAQQNIRNILAYLAQENLIQAVAVEGAFGNVEPELLNLTSTPSINQKMINHLAEQGQITGAELFGLDHSKTKIRGADNRELYVRSFEIYREIKSNKKQIEEILGVYHRSLEKLEVKILNEKLRVYIQKKRIFAQNPEDFLLYLDVLKKLSSEILKLELGNARNQFDWPNLTRIVKAKETESIVHQQLVSKDRDALIQELKSKLPTGKNRDYLINGLRYFVSDDTGKPFESWLVNDKRMPKVKTIRHFFEVLYEEAGEHQIALSNFGQLLMFAGISILREEIDVTGLFKEINTLEGKLEEQLIQKETERKLIHFEKDFLLVKNLISLTLSRQEYEDFTHRKNELSSQALAERIHQFVPKKIKFPFIPEQTLALAEEFYQLSRKRDQILFDKTLALANSAKGKAVVLISGGFHSQGVTDLLKEKEIPYLVLSPRMTHFADDSLYEKVMLGENALVRAPLAVQPEQFPIPGVQQEILLRELMQMNDFPNSAQIIAKAKRDNPILNQKKVASKVPAPKKTAIKVPPKTKPSPRAEAPLAPTEPRTPQPFLRSAKRAEVRATIPLSKSLDELNTRIDLADFNPPREFATFTVGEALLVKLWLALKKRKSEERLPFQIVVSLEEQYFTDEELKEFIEEISSWNTDKISMEMLFLDTPGLSDAAEDFVKFLRQKQGRSLSDDDVIGYWNGLRNAYGAAMRRLERRILEHNHYIHLYEIAPGETSRGFNGAMVQRVEVPALRKTLKPIAWAFGLGPKSIEEIDDLGNVISNSSNLPFMIVPYDGEAERDGVKISMKHGFTITNNTTASIVVAVAAKGTEAQQIANDDLSHRAEVRNFTSSTEIIAQIEALASAISELFRREKSNPKKFVKSEVIGTFVKLLDDLIVTSAHEPRKLPKWARNQHGVLAELAMRLQERRSSNMSDVAYKFLPEEVMGIIRQINSQSRAEVRVLERYDGKDGVYRNYSLKQAASLGEIIDEIVRIEKLGSSGNISAIRTGSGKNGLDLKDRTRLIPAGTSLTVSFNSRAEVREGNFRVQAQALLSDLEQKLGTTLPRLPQREDFLNWLQNFNSTFSEQPEQSIDLVALKEQIESAFQRDVQAKGLLSPPTEVAFKEFIIALQAIAPLEFVVDHLNKGFPTYDAYGGPHAFSVLIPLLDLVDDRLEEPFSELMTAIEEEHPEHVGQTGLLFGSISAATFEFLEKRYGYHRNENLAKIFHDKPFLEIKRILAEYGYRLEFSETAQPHFTLIPLRAAARSSFGERADVSPKADEVRTSELKTLRDPKQIVQEIEKLQQEQDYESNGQRIYELTRELLQMAAYEEYDQIREIVLNGLVDHDQIEKLEELIDLVYKPIPSSEKMARRILAVSEVAERVKQEAIQSAEDQNKQGTISWQFDGDEGVIARLKKWANHFDAATTADQIEDEDKDFANAVASSLKNGMGEFGVVSGDIEDHVKQQIWDLTKNQNNWHRNWQYRDRVRHFNSKLIHLSFSSEESRQVAIFSLMGKAATLMIEESQPLLVYLITQLLRYGYAVSEEEMGPVFRLTDMANAAILPGITYLLRSLAAIIFSGNSGQQLLKVDEPERARTRSGEYGIGIEGVIRDEIHNKLGIHVLGLLERQLEYYRVDDPSVLYSPDYQVNVLKDRKTIPLEESSRFPAKIVSELDQFQAFNPQTGKNFMQALYRHFESQVKSEKRNFYEILRTISDEELQAVIDDVNQELGTHYIFRAKTRAVDPAGYLWVYRELSARYAMGNFERLYDRFVRLSPVYMDRSATDRLNTAIHERDYLVALEEIAKVKFELRKIIYEVNPRYDGKAVREQFNIDFGRDDIGNAVGGALVHDRKLRAYQADYYLSQIEGHFIDEVSSHQFREITNENRPQVLKFIQLLSFLGYINGDYDLDQVEHAETLNQAVPASVKEDLRHLMLREVSQMDTYYHQLIQPTIEEITESTSLADIDQFLDGQKKHKKFSLKEKQTFVVLNTIEQIRRINKENKRLKNLLEKLSGFPSQEPQNIKSPSIPIRSYVVLGVNSTPQEIDDAMEMGRYRLGAKGIGLIQALKLGIPVPPFAIFSNELTIAQIELLLPEVMEKLDQAIKGQVNMGLGSTFANGDRPYFLSVRASTYLTMPGQTDTATNVGMRGQNILAFARRLQYYGISEENALWTAWDSYRRFLEDYGKVVYDLKKSAFDAIIETYKREKNVKLKEELSPSQMAEVALAYLNLINEKTEHDVSEETPKFQLQNVIDAVKASFDKASPYLQSRNIKGDWPGASIIIQAMTYGNIRENSGAGVVYTRNPNDWRYGIDGSFKPFAQGPDLADHSTTPQLYRDLSNGSWTEQIQRWGTSLEQLRGANVEMEFAVQQTNGKPQPWLLQARDAYIPEAFPFFAEKPEPENILFTAQGTSGGAFRGIVVYRPEEITADLLNHAQQKGGDGVILLSDTLEPHEIPTLAEKGIFQNALHPDKNGKIVRVAVITRRGGYTSHTSDLTRELKIPAVVGASVLEYSEEKETWSVGNQAIKRGDQLSLDGRTGVVSRGFLPVRSEVRAKEITSFHLPGAPPLLEGSDEAQQILALIAEKQRLGQVELMDQERVTQIGISNYNISPLESILKNAYRQLLSEILQGMMNQSFDSIQNYPEGTNFLSELQIQIVDLGQDTFFRASEEGQHYYSISEYKPETQSLQIYLPKAFVEEYFPAGQGLEPDKMKSSYKVITQLVLYGLLREILKLSHQETALILPFYNAYPHHPNDVKLSDLHEAILRDALRQIDRGDKVADYAYQQLLNTESVTTPDYIKQDLRENRGFSEDEIRSFDIYYSKYSTALNKAAKSAAESRTSAEKSPIEGIKETEIRFGINRELELAPGMIFQTGEALSSVDDPNDMSIDYESLFNQPVLIYDEIAKANFLVRLVPGTSVLPEKPTLAVYFLEPDLKLTEDHVAPQIVVTEELPDSLMTRPANRGVTFSFDSIQRIIHLKRSDSNFQISKVRDMHFDWMKDHLSTSFPQELKGGWRRYTLFHKGNPLAEIEENQKSYRLRSKPFPQANRGALSERLHYHAALLEYLHEYTNHTGLILRWFDARYDHLKNFLIGDRRANQVQLVDSDLQLSGEASYAANPEIPYRDEAPFAFGGLIGRREIHGTILPPKDQVFHLVYRKKEAPAKDSTVLTPREIVDHTYQSQHYFLVLPEKKFLAVGTGTIVSKVGYQAEALGISAIATNRSANERAKVMEHHGIPLVVLEESNEPDFKKAGIPVLRKGDKAITALELAESGELDRIVEGLSGKDKTTGLTVSQILKEKLFERVKSKVQTTYQAETKGIADATISLQPLHTAGLTYDYFIQKFGKPENFSIACTSCNETNLSSIVAALSPRNTEKYGIELAPGETRIHTDLIRRRGDLFSGKDDLVEDIGAEWTLGTHHALGVWELFEELPEDYRIPIARSPEGKARFTSNASFGTQQLFHRGIISLQAKKTDGNYLTADEMKKLLGGQPHLVLVSFGKKGKTSPQTTLDILFNQMGIRHPMIAAVDVTEHPSNSNAVTIDFLTFQESNVVPNNLGLLLLSMGLVRPEDSREAMELVYESLGIYQIRRELLAYQGKDPLKADRAEVRAEAQVHRPLKYLIADKTKPTIVKELQSVADSFGGKVTLIANQMGIGSKPDDLSKFVSEQKIDGLFFRSDIQGLKDPPFVEQIHRAGIVDLVRIGAGVDNADKQATVDNKISLIRTNGNQHPVSILAAYFLIAALGGFKDSVRDDQHFTIDPELQKIIDITLEQFRKAYEAVKADRGEMSEEQWEALFHNISPDRARELFQKLDGKTISLIGFGPLGQDFADVLNQIRTTLGISFRILATSSALNDANNPNHEARVKAAREYGVEFPGEEEVLKQADILSFHLPGDAKNYFDVAKLNTAAKARIILNTARFDVIQPNVWTEFFKRPESIAFLDIDLKKNGKIIAEVKAQIDAYPNQFIATPHVAASTEDPSQGIEKASAETFRRLINLRLGNPTERPDIVNGIVPTATPAEIRMPSEPQKIPAWLTQEEATSRLNALLTIGTFDRLNAYYAQAIEKNLSHDEILKGLEPELAQMADILRAVRPSDDLDKLMGFRDFNIQPRQLDILRATSEFILQFVPEEEGVDNFAQLAKIKNTFVKYPEISNQLIQYFEEKFNPHKDLRTRAKDSQLIRLSLNKKLPKIIDEKERFILSLARDMMIATVKTDYYVSDRTELSFRIVPKVIRGYELNDVFGYSSPYAIIWVHVPYGAYGAHSRYIDIARGGLRSLRPGRTQLRSRVLSEAVALSFTQNAKHMSIPEGGSKGVFIQEEGLNPIAAAIGYIDGLVNHMMSHKSIVVSSGYPAIDPLELGPDEGTADIGSLATVRAWMKGLKDWRLLMSGKLQALGGVSHMENNLLTPHEKGNRVTSQGVMVHAFELVRYLRDIGQIESKTHEPVKLSTTGGLRGDVTSGIVEIAIRHYGDLAQILTLSDSSAVAFDPEGLDHKTLLDMYAKKSQTKLFPQDKLHEGGFVFEVKEGESEDSYVTLGSETLVRMNTKAFSPEFLAESGADKRFRQQAKIGADKPLVVVLEKDDEGHPKQVKVHSAYLRDVIFFLVRSDLLITGGGVKDSMNDQNWGLFFDWKGKPTAPGIVHGANVFITDAANRILESKGVVIEPDEKANSVGVEVSSRMEMDFNMIFRMDEIKPELMRSYFEQVLAKLRESAQIKFWALRLEAEAKPNKSIVTETSPMMSEDVIRLMDVIGDSRLVGDRKGDYSEFTLPYLTNYFPDVSSLDGEFKSTLDRVFGRMRPNRIRLIASKTIALDVVLNLGTGTTKLIAEKTGKSEVEVIETYLTIARHLNIEAQLKEIVENPSGLSPRQQINQLEILKERTRTEVEHALSRSEVRAQKPELDKFLRQNDRFGRNSVANFLGITRFVTFSIALPVPAPLIPVIQLNLFGIGSDGIALANKISVQDQIRYNQQLDQARRNAPNDEFTNRQKVVVIVGNGDEIPKVDLNRMALPPGSKVILFDSVNSRTTSDYYNRLGIPGVQIVREEAKGLQASLSEIKNVLANKPDSFPIVILPAGSTESDLHQYSSASTNGYVVSAPHRADAQDALSDVLGHYEPEQLHKLTAAQLLEYEVKDGSLSTIQITPSNEPGFAQAYLAGLTQGQARAVALQRAA